MIDPLQDIGGNTFAWFWDEEREKHFINEIEVEEDEDGDWE